MCNKNVNFHVLDAHATSLLFFFTYRNTARDMIRAGTAPPAAPAIIAIRLCPLCFFLLKIVTCGVSIEGLDETSLHVIVENKRHKFPDVLYKVDLSEC